jgi:hypothetical protein
VVQQDTYSSLGYDVGTWEASFFCQDRNWLAARDRREKEEVKQVPL